MIRKLFAGASVLAVAVIAVMLMTVGGSAKPAEAHVLGVSGVAQTPSGSITLITINAIDGDGDLYVTASAGTYVACFGYGGGPCVDYGATTFPLPIQSFFIDDGGTDTSVVEAIWWAPPGFPGGAVMFTACQQDQNGWPFCSAAKTFTMQIMGAPASISLKAQRGYTNESSVCADTPVYIIAATEYTFNNPTTFNNDRAIICADVRDSANHPLVFEPVAWMTTDGCLTDATTNTLFNGLTHNRLASCGVGASGDVATVTANAGVVSNAVQVAFGGDPVKCSVVTTPNPLDIGDTASVTATFLDAKGNLVPDGIVAHLEEVDSGDGADNVDFVSVPEDTVKGVVQGNIIAAIAGLTTVAASIETIAGADPTCSEALELTGDVHMHEGDGGILYGNKPPAGGGFGTFAFGGGTFEQLLLASGCPKATAVFFYNKPSGSFAVWIPGTDVSTVNDEIFTIFPNEHQPIPKGTIFTAKCK